MMHTPRHPAAAIADQAEQMDHMYRYQRHFYDLTRKHYLIGRDRLLQALVINNGDCVLEAGCGTGRNLIALAQKGKEAKLYGLDASHEMLKTCGAKVAQAGHSDRVILRQCLAEELCYRRTFDLAQPFDVIFFSYALSMIPTWRQAVDRALANLKTGGSLYILDFWDGADLPVWFSTLLMKWLAQFHVYHRPELLDYLHTLAAATRRESRFALTPIGRRYSFLVQLQKI